MPPSPCRAGRRRRIADTISSGIASLVLLGVITGCAGGTPRADKPLPAEARASVVTVETDRGRGAGLVLGRDGEIVTNAHVVADSLRVRVRRHDGELGRADVIGRDARLGLALLRLEQDRLLSPGTHGRPSRLRSGDVLRWVVDPTDPATDGSGELISMQRNSGGRREGLSFIEIQARDTAAPAAGVVFDAEGRVVGLNAAVREPGGAGRRLYAIPIDTIVDALDFLRTTGRVTRAQIGIDLQPVTLKLAAALGFNRARGALVAGVTDNGPAARAGIRRGDIVLEFAGRSVERAQDLPDLIAAVAPGKPVAVLLWRGDGTRQVMITPEELRKP